VVTTSTCASRKDATMASTAHQPSENTYTGSDPTNQAPKRKRSRDGDNEQGTRRVAQRTDNNSATLSMKSLLLEDLQSANITRSWLKDWRVLKCYEGRRRGPIICESSRVSKTRRTFYGCRYHGEAHGFARYPSQLP
jgi:hypothetical protein